MGAQRAGSTFLADVIANHPDVELPSLELPVFEPRFFSERSLELLGGYFTESAKKRGLKRPDYLGLPGVAENIAKSYPEIKLLAVLRDPIQRFLSAAHWYMFTGAIPVQEPDSLVRQLSELDIKPGLSDRIQENPYLQLLEFGAYARCIRRYLSWVPMERLLLVFQDFLSPAAREAQFDAIWTFLELPKVESSDVGRVRQNGAVYDLRRLRFLSHRPQSFNWEDRQEFCVVKNRWMAKPLHALGSAAFHGIDRVFLKPVWKGPNPTLGSDARSWLSNYYAGDVEDLSTIINLPPGWTERYVP